MKTLVKSYQAVMDPTNPIKKGGDLVTKKSLCEARPKIESYDWNNLKYLKMPCYRSNINRRLLIKPSLPATATVTATSSSMRVSGKRHGDQEHHATKRGKIQVINWIYIYLGYCYS